MSLDDLYLDLAAWSYSSTFDGDDPLQDQGVCVKMIGQAGCGRRVRRAMIWDRRKDHEI